MDDSQYQEAIRETASRRLRRVSRDLEQITRTVRAFLKSTGDDEMLSDLWQLSCAARSLGEEFCQSEPPVVPDYYPG